jgi:iron complex outermembrane receptor protein
MHPYRLALLACSAFLLCAAPGQAQEPAEAPEDAAEEEEEEIIVQGTRTRRRVQDEPIRVEVIVREEIEEKLLMRPGNIARLVNETGGIRVQVTSPRPGRRRLGRHPLLRTGDSTPEAVLGRR